MKPNLHKQIIEALKDQKEIFGDELLEPVELKRKTVTEPKQARAAKVKEPPIEFSKDTTTSTTANHPKEEWENSSSLDELNKLISSCTKCGLAAGRNKLVFGVGNPNADVLVIGEGPGADEDKQGEPFVGRAGQLLTDILKAINFAREEIYIANIVKCRPPGNRTPFPDEMETCLPYLRKQVAFIKPKVILCLGLTAAKGLLNLKDSLGNLRGKVYKFEDAQVMVTYHPAALLRNPNWKRPAWEDVKQFRKLYDDLS
ncbi:MAG: uracil-DNA glycosylase, partial [Ignavibacteriaceae bacterium]|nr:uracil-DNA glycosylase [Ignavibacteriaceae bacterium]